MADILKAFSSRISIDTATELYVNFTDSGLLQLEDVVDNDLLWTTLRPTRHGIHAFSGFLMCLLALSIYDIVFAYGKPGRWFHIHAVANAVTVIFSLPAMILWIKKPLSVLNYIGQETPDPLGDNWLSQDVLLHPSNDWAVLMVVAVHTYHCIAFDLSAQDVFHHMMFIPTLGVYGGFAVKWGPIRNCLAFFMSGLPGGIDYFNLVLLKRGLIDKLSVKRISSKLNVWCRGPGCGVLIPATSYACYTEGRMLPEQVVSAFCLSIFATFNGLYYMEMAVKNYQMHLTRTVMEETHSAELAKMKSYWQEKEAATKQRRSTAGEMVGTFVEAFAGDDGPSESFRGVHCKEA